MRHGKDHRRVGKHCTCDVEEHQKSAPVQHSDADDANPETDVGRQGEHTRKHHVFLLTLCQADPLRRFPMHMVLAYE